MQNNTSESRACQGQSGEKVLPNESLRSFQEARVDVKNARAASALKEKISDGLTTSAIIAEFVGNPRLQDCGPKPLPPTDPNSAEANFPNWAKDPFKTKEPPISKVIETCNQSNETPAKKKNIEESRKLLDTFKEKLGSYPKVLTYEGAVVLCVMLSVNEGESINLNGMPMEDKALILSLLPPTSTAHLLRCDATLKVEFDEAKDFVLTYTHKDEASVILKFFNTVIHPQKLPDTNVPVEQDGGKVMVGGTVILDQKRIQKLIGVVPQEKSHRDDDDEPPRRPTVAGRNAYEIRADVLQMAIDWSVKSNEFGTKTEDNVINLAKKFYEFVEDRRRR